VLLRHVDGTLSRGAGIALLANLLLFPERFSAPARTIGRAYMYRFWRPANRSEWLDVVAALLLWPVAIVVSTLWFTWRNGGVVADRVGRSRIRQCADQLRLTLTSGLLPPWYYVFELYRPGELRKARAYLTRSETKHGANPLLREARRSSSPLADKGAFAAFCAERQIRAIPVLFSVHDGEVRYRGSGPVRLPRTDLFVKPARGWGGSGAERWDHLGKGRYRGPCGDLSAGELVGRLREMSRSRPYLVQARARNHPAIRDLSNGALNTIRMITCLDECERPEIIGAVLRMAVGTNITVDNVYAGGIAAAVDFRTGQLNPATQAGFDARRGWIDRHPDTGAQITSRMLPRWQEVCDLARRAHSAFSDWVVIGWDIAILRDGPWLVEGNNGPNVELIQRPLRTAFADSRFGELLAFHLNQTESVWRH
jgi:hypothetical protein